MPRPGRVHLHRVEPAVRARGQAHRRGDDVRRQPLVPWARDRHAQHPPHAAQELVGRRPDDAEQVRAQNQPQVNISRAVGRYTAARRQVGGDDAR